MIVLFGCHLFMGNNRPKHCVYRNILFHRGFDIFKLYIFNIFEWFNQSIFDSLISIFLKKLYENRWFFSIHVNHSNSLCMNMSFLLLFTLTVKEFNWILHLSNNKKKLWRRKKNWIVLKIVNWENGKKIFFVNKINNLII